MNYLPVSIWFIIGFIIGLVLSRCATLFYEHHKEQKRLKRFRDAIDKYPELINKYKSNSDPKDVLL